MGRHNDLECSFSQTKSEILGLIWGRIGPSQFKNEQKLPKMVYIIPKVFVLVKIS